MRALIHSLRGGSLLMLLALFAVSCSTPSTAGPVANQPTPTSTPIQESEVDAAQKAWCDDLVKIAKLSRTPGGDWEAEARKFVDQKYDFSWNGKLLFRPTLAYTPNAFRTDQAGTLSYFIGGNSSYPDGDGFARGQWKECVHDNKLRSGVDGIQIYQDLAIAMGTVTLTDCHDNKTTVDKVFVFRRQPPSRELRLVVHMSAKSNLPPGPTPTPTPTPGPCPPEPK